MRLQTAVAAAISAAVTSAFLITPEIASAVSHAEGFATALIAGNAPSLDVKCHKCPFISDENQDGLLRPADDEELEENSIHLEFSTSGSTLLVNNETVYPFGSMNKGVAHVFAHQVRADNGQEGVDVLVEFSLESQTPPKSPSSRYHHNRIGQAESNKDEDKFELVLLDFTVLGIGGVPVKVQTAHLNVISHDDKLFIVDVQGAPFDPTSPGENDLELCQTAMNVQLCRVRMMIAQRLRAMTDAAKSKASQWKEWMRTHGPGNKARPCPGMMRHGAHPHPSGADRPGFGYHNRHGHGFGHRYGEHRYHGHRYGHRFLRMIMFLIKTIIIPAVLGFTAGMLIGFVGLMAGHTVVFFWGLIRGRSGSARVDEIVIEGGEKDSLMYHDQPPAYHDEDDLPQRQNVSSNGDDTKHDDTKE